MRSTQVRRLSLLMTCFAALAVAGSGCSTLRVNPERVRATKKVAVVGFAVEQEMPPTFTIELGNKSKSKSEFAGPRVSMPEESEHARLMYASLSERLKQDLKWSVHAPEAVARDFNYEALRQQKTTGWQSRPLTGENISSFTAPGIVDGWTIDRMSAEERAELAKHLGVDAIAVAQLRVELKKGGGLKQLVGAGDYFPQATLTFKVYEPKGDETFWQDTWARGEPVAEGTGHFAGLTNAAALNRQVVVAAEDAYRALIKRYQAKASEKL